MIFFFEMVWFKEERKGFVREKERGKGGKKQKVGSANLRKESLSIRAILEAARK
jgi:hypothetical protein